LALRYEKAGRITSINYMVIVYSFIIDALVFNVDIKWTDILGATFIIFFTIVNTVISCFDKSK
jgi:drug/metabolite transporter (DMT)-like permease